MYRELPAEPFILGETEISNTTAVCCRSESGAKEFLRYLDSDGWTWGNKDRLTSKTYWNLVEESIVYFLYPRQKTVAYGMHFDSTDMCAKCYIFHDEDDFAQKDEQEVLALIG